MIKNIVVGLAVLCLVWMGFGATAQAAQTVPHRLNYQGQLTDDLNNAKADGQYNIRFRIFSASSGGTALWTETHDVAGGNGVELKRGLFNVQLGSITSLSPSLFTSQPLYLEVELPTPGTATSASPSWTEGAMTPRQPMASQAYAMNADTIDGIDGASLAQLSASQTLSGDNTFSGTFLQQNTSSTAFRVQNAGGTNALLIDTSSLAVKVGGGDVTPDASPALLVLDYKTTTGDPAGTNGAMYYNQATKKLRCYEAGVWGNCIPENRTLYRHYADFLNGGTVVNGTTLDSTLLFGAANSSTGSRIAGELNHPGIIRMDLGSAASAAVAMASNFDTGNTTSGVRFGGATWTMATQVRLSALSNVTNSYISYNGFVDNINQLATGGLQNGCMVIHNHNFNGGRWTGWCENNNSSSTCNPLDSGSTQLSIPSTGVWYTLTTVVNAAGTLATFIVEGNGQTGTCTISTNLPTLTLSFGNAMLRLAGSATGITQDTDYMETKATGLSRN